MFKKITSLFLIFAMLVTLSSAVAAEEMNSQPTTEEIMSENHIGTISRQPVNKLADNSFSSQIPDPEQNLASEISDGISFDNNLVIVHDQEKNNLIDELFALRCELAIDFEKNQEEIAYIDNQLAQLGVETISYAEVQSKAGADVLPNVEFSSSDPNTQWTSRRTVVTYRGQQYELQTIEGIPLNGNSWLRRNDAEVAFAATDIVAGVTEAIEIVSLTALGMIPGLEELSMGVSLLSMIVDAPSAIMDSLSTTTVLEDVSGSATLSFSTHVKLIYVKGYGSSDSYQKLGYFGNYLYFAMSAITVLDGPVGDHGSLPVHNVELFNSFTAYSAYFNDYTKSVENYVNYRSNNLANYNPDYIMQYLTLDLFGTRDVYLIPISTPHVTGLTSY